VKKFFLSSVRTGPARIFSGSAANLVSPACTNSNSWTWSILSIPWTSLCTLGPCLAVHVSPLAFLALSLCIFHYILALSVRIPFLPRAPALFLGFEYQTVATVTTRLNYKVVGFVSVYERADDTTKGDGRKGFRGPGRHRVFSTGQREYCSSMTHLNSRRSCQSHLSQYLLFS
jgi:hypothetical protein